LHAYVAREPARVPPGAGAFSSGHADTAERAEELLAEAGFGGGGAPPHRRSRATAATKRPRSRK